MRAFQRLAVIGTLVAGTLSSLPACEAKRSNGEPCIKDRDCDSDVCRAGVCVAEPISNPPSTTTDTGTETVGGGGATPAGGSGGVGGVGGAGGALGGGGGSGGGGSGGGGGS